MLSAGPGPVSARSSRPVAPLHLRPRIGAESICEQQSISAGAALSRGEQLTVRGRGSWAEGRRAGGAAVRGSKSEAILKIMLFPVERPDMYYFFFIFVYLGGSKVSLFSYKNKERKNKGLFG